MDKMDTKLIPLEDFDSEGWYIGEAIYFDGNITVPKDLKLVKFRGNITVGGNIFIHSTSICFGGRTQVRGRIYTTGDISAADNMEVHGDLNAHSINTSGNITVLGGNLNVMEETIVGGNLDVYGNAKSRKLNVVGDLDVNGKLTATELDVKGRFHVKGGVKLG